MDQLKQPTKEQVREYMKRRRESPKPPPDPKQVRRELGWGYIDVARKRRGMS